MSDSQGASELVTFRSFVECAELPVVFESIRKRQPPEADIECELSDHGLTSFELVEIVDADFARLVSDQVRLEDSLRRRSAVDPLNEFSNALVCIRFVASARIAQREREIGALFQFLRTLPAGFDGVIPVPAQCSLSATVRFVTVRRGDFVGPHFQVEAFGFLSDPILDRIRVKFAKRYRTQNRLELLAFYEIHPVRPRVMKWLKAVEEYVDANLATSQFSRAWLFDASAREVLFRSDGDLTMDGRTV